MGLPVDPLEVPNGDVSVQRRRPEVLVPQHLLDDPHVGPVFQHERGHRVPQEMTTPPPRESRPPQGRRHQLAHLGLAQRIAADRHEAPLHPGGPHVPGPDVPKVGIQPTQGSVPDRNHPVPVPLAVADKERAPLPIDVLELEMHQFAPAESGGIEHLEDGPVPEADRPAPVGNGENRIHLLRIQHPPRQSPRTPRDLELQRRVGLQGAGPGEPPPEPPQGQDCDRTGPDRNRPPVPPSPSGQMPQVVCQQSRVEDHSRAPLPSPDHERPQVPCAPPKRAGRPTGPIEGTQVRVDQAGKRWSSLPTPRACALRDHAPGYPSLPTAPRQIRSQSSPNSTPIAAALCGIRLVAVIPGRVFTSRHQSPPWGSSRKSTRE